jgi:hypothetical protein
MNAFSMKNMAMVITSPKINEFLESHHGHVYNCFQNLCAWGDTHFNSSYTSTQCDMPFKTNHLWNQLLTNSYVRIMWHVQEQCTFHQLQNSSLLLNCCVYDGIFKMTIDVLLPIHNIIDLASNISKFDVMTYKTFFYLVVQLCIERRILTRSTNLFYFDGDDGLISTSFL